MTDNKSVKEFLRLFKFRWKADAFLDQVQAITLSEEIENPWLARAALLLPCTGRLREFPLPRENVLRRSSKSALNEDCLARSGRILHRVAALELARLEYREYSPASAKRSGKHRQAALGSVIRGFENLWHN
jgi:hypothetical protein